MLYFKFGTYNFEERDTDHKLSVIIVGDLRDLKTYLFYDDRVNRGFLYHSRLYPFLSYLLF